MKELEVLQRKLERERKARKQAEQLLEVKSLELYRASEQLQEANKRLKRDIRSKESTLQQTEKKYQELVETAQDIIYTISPDGHFKFINPAVTHILGFSPEELVGVHYLELVVEDHKAMVREYYTAQMENKEESTYLEFPVHTRDGKVRWLGQKVRIDHGEGDQVTLSAIARDITEVIKSTKQLQDLSKRLSTILESLNEAILVEDEHRMMVLVNQRFCDIFNIPVDPSLLIGSDCSESAEQVKHLFKDPEKFVRDIDKLLRERKPSSHEIIEMADGMILERDYIPIYNKDIYMGHLWRYQDVTAKIRSDRNIRMNEEKYRNVIENMRLGLMEVNKEGVIVKAYDRFCEMTGYTAEELEGQKANNILLDEEARDRMQQQDNERMEGQSAVYEIQVQKKNGEKSWFRIGGTPNFNSEGKNIGSIGIHYDITREKNLQKQLEEARAIAEKARDAEKEFLANMSHEIRNPILAIDGMANLLYDTSLDQQQTEYLDNLRNASRILLALVSGILDIYKITEGKMEVNPEVFNLPDMLDAIEKMTQFRLSNKPIEFKLFVDKKIPTNLIGDVTFLHQILLNLTGNATKFTHEGSISLQVRSIRKDHSTCWVQFEVRDTGIGIEKNRIDRIFERFSQAGKAVRHNYGGTGLGLPITKNLTELMGGSISVESEAGEGSIFKVVLPFEIPKASRDPEIEHTGIKGPKDRLRLHILIVEDNEVNRLYLKRLLDKFGHSYADAANGKEALKLLNDQLFDLILMDIRMPIMDGYETTISLRSQHQNQNSLIPIIALTASALLDEKEKALRAGMNYHLTKPFTPEALQNAIEQFYPLIEANNKPTDNKKNVTPGLKRYIDPDTIEELYQGDREHLEMMVDMFIDGSDQMLDHLEKSAQSGSWEDLRAHAHKYHPSFLMVGLKKYSHQLKRLESDLEGSSFDGEAASEMVSKFCREVRKILPELKEQLLPSNKKAK